MELVRAPRDFPGYLPEAACNRPGYQARDKFGDDFHCFLEEQFSASTPQQPAAPVSEPRSDATASLDEHSSLTLPSSRPQPPKSRDQRRKTHNRAAQKQWREKQKVGARHAL